MSLIPLASLKPLPLSSLKQAALIRTDKHLVRVQLGVGEVGAGDAAHGRGEDHEVDRRQLTPLQAQGSHLPRVQDGEEQRALQLTIFNPNT